MPQINRLIAQIIIVMAVVSVILSGKYIIVNLASKLQQIIVFVCIVSSKYITKV